MATADQYAEWIVKNQDLKGTEKFNTVAQAYQEAKQQEAIEFQSGSEKSVLDTENRNPLKVFGQSLVKGVTGLGDIATQLSPLELAKRTVASGQQALQGNFGQAVQEALPKQPITDLAKRYGLIRAENQPNTPALGVLDFTGQLLGGGGINPAQIARTGIEKGAIEGAKLLGRQGGMATAQGLLGGSTNELLKSSGWNEAGRVLPTMAVMGVPGAIYAARNTPSKVINQAIGNVSPEQLKQAQALQDYSFSINAPVTGAEAISRVTGGNPIVGTQRIVENVGDKSPQIMSEFMSQRPTGNEQAMAQALRQISPQTELLSTTPSKLQTTAQNIIENAKTARTNITSPNFVEAGKQAFKKDDLTGLMSDDYIKEAIDFVRKTPKYGVKGFADNDARTLMAAKEYLADTYKAQLSAVSGQTAEKAAPHAWKSHEKLTNFLETNIPEFKSGQVQYQGLTKGVLEPLSKSQIGQLAETTGIPEQQIRSQAGILMPETPKATNPTEIAATVRLLRQQDPNIAQDWTRQNLQSIFNESTQEIKGKPNQFGAANFATKITGNKQQNANLKALVSESSSPEAWKGFENMLDVFKAQGERLPAGSATAYNQQAIQEFEKGGAAGWAKWVTGLPTAIREQVQRFELGNNTEMLAKMLTDPKSVEKLEELSKVKPDSRKAQNIVNTIVGGSIAEKPELFTIEVEGKKENK